MCGWGGNRESIFKEPHSWRIANDLCWFSSVRDNHAGYELLKTLISTFFTARRERDNQNHFTIHSDEYSILIWLIIAGSRIILMKFLCLIKSLLVARRIAFGRWCWRHSVGDKEKLANWPNFHLWCSSSHLPMIISSIRLSITARESSMRYANSEDIPSRTRWVQDARRETQSVNLF